MAHTQKMWPPTPPIPQQVSGRGTREGGVNAHTPPHLEVLEPWGSLDQQLLPLFGLQGKPFQQNKLGWGPGLGRGEGIEVAQDRDSSPPRAVPTLSTYQV